MSLPLVHQEGQLAPAELFKLCVAVQGSSVDIGAAFEISGLQAQFQGILESKGAEIVAFSYGGNLYHLSRLMNPAIAQPCGYAFGIADEPAISFQQVNGGWQLDALKHGRERNQAFAEMAEVLKCPAMVIKRDYTL